MKLKIIGKTYDISFVAQEELPKDYGECNDEQQTIKIRKDLNAEHQADVLLHEVLHAVSFAMNAKLSERQVHTVASGLLAVIYDNPEFMGWICLQSRQVPKKAVSRQKK